MIAFANLLRHGCVICSVYQRLGYTQREQILRTSSGIPIRDLSRRASEKAFDDSRAEPQIRALDQIYGTCKGYCAFEGQGALGPQRMTRGEARSAGHPKRQVTSSGKADGDHPRQIQSVLWSDRGEKVHGCSDVMKGARPTSALFADASVFDIPGCDTCGGQGCTEVRVRIQPVRGTPPTSVDANDDGELARTSRQPQITKLTGGGRAIAQALVEVRRGAREQIK